MPKPYPKEFRDDVRGGRPQGDSTIRQIAQDFGISESCLANWLKQADVEDGMRPGVTAAEAAESRRAEGKVDTGSRSSRRAIRGLCERFTRSITRCPYCLCRDTLTGVVVHQRYGLSYGREPASLSSCAFRSCCLAWYG